jgi:hypothetical protein
MYPHELYVTYITLGSFSYKAVLIDSSENMNDLNLDKAVCRTEPYIGTFHVHISFQPQVGFSQTMGK